MKILAPFLIALSLVASCSEAETQAAEAQASLEEAWDEVKTFGIEQREEFGAALRQRMDVVAQSFDELSETARAEARSQAEALEANLASLADETTETWDATRDSFIERIEDLERFVEASLDS